jgi:hypothetical protein
MVYYFPICNKHMDMAMTNSELTVWICLGLVYIVCGIFTFFIVRAEK